MASVALALTTSLKFLCDARSRLQKTTFINRLFFVCFFHLIFRENTCKAWLRNPGRDISFPIFIRKEIETRKLERKSKQKISRLIGLLYRLNDIISR